MFKMKIFAALLTFLLVSQKVNAWGGLFNRFSPEMLANMGYGGHGGGAVVRDGEDNFLEEYVNEGEDEPCYGKRCTANEHCCPGSVCVDVDGGTYEEKLFQTVEKLRKFNEYLNSEENLRKTCIRLSLVGGKDEATMTRKILATVISHNLALNLNWSGRNDKGGLKDYTSFIKCITMIGSCLFAYGRRVGELCRRDSDCESGLVCAESDSGPNARVCRPPVHQDKQYSEPCHMSSECDISRGLCCQLQRRHRQAPRKVCSYFKDPLVCIGPVATDQIKNTVEHTAGEKRITGMAAFKRPMMH